MHAKNRKIIAAGVFSLLAAGSAPQAALINFENLTLANDSYWNGSAAWDGEYPSTPAESPKTYNNTFSSGGATFNNQFQAWTWGQEPPYFNYTSWSGWAYSNRVRSTGSGFGYQYDAKPGAAADGSIFGVAYYSEWGGVIPTITFAQPTLLGVGYFTNTTYAYDSIKNGDGFASPISEGGWFKATVTGRDANGQVTGTLDIYLADYRSSNSDDWYIVDYWKAVDLSGLGPVKSLEFRVSGSDSGWPTYVAMDALIPEPSTALVLTVGALALGVCRRSRS